MNQLKSYLEDYISISSSDWSYIEPKLKYLKGNKGDILTEQGKTEQNLYFICTGLARLYHEAEAKDITVNFGFPNDFISAYSSFLTKEPSHFMLHLLTDAELIAISKSDLEEIYENTNCGHELGRILTEKIFLYLSERETAFMLKSPTQRYLDLFKEHPRLIQEIPQKYLASYIGITPQALSRIRAKL